MTRVHIISPARNESQNLVALLGSLEEQINNPFDIYWTIVVNNSKDNTLEIANSLRSILFEINVVEFSSTGNLSSAADYLAFWKGVESSPIRKFDYIMKLDCDVRLYPNYFSSLSIKMGGRDGLFGGINVTKGERTQLDSRLVRGATSCYSMNALEYLRREPIALGYEVMDKVYLLDAGFACEIIPTAKYEVSRKTSSSEGILRGRVRDGITCRNVGYSKIYFVLHLLRLTFKKPILLGAGATIYGYIKTRTSPFPLEMRSLQKKYQVDKLKVFFRQPISWIKKNYFSHY